MAATIKVAICKKRDGLCKQLAFYSISNEALFQHAKSQGIPYLFVQVPYKSYDGIKELEGYLPETRRAAEDALCDGLSQRGVPVLDLREFLTGYTYYRTDHHWDTDAAFEASRLICNRLNTLWNFGLDKDGTLTNIGNYEKVVYEDCLLGSNGIRTGEYYTGKDDFILYYPKFQTDLTHSHYDTNGVLTNASAGVFEEAFIDKTILEDESYYNKYNANLHGGYVENIIINRKSENRLKALVIAHSYGRSMVPYFSLLFAQTHYVDPQSGRYTGNLIEYIDAYQPDVIICMYNNPLCVG